MNVSLFDRRRFFQAGFAAASLPFLPSIAFGGGLEDERTAWFRDAKFGMFIHWGPYSLASVEASWPIMRPDNWQISESEYRSLPQRFNPAHYDPDHFVDLARSAGQEYMVFTTKHHDGFCMFDSSYTDYKITNTPYKKDIVKQLSDACSRRNMKLGFYYSPPDLNHPGYRDTSKLAKDNWNGQPERPEWSSYLAYMQLQLTELLTRYGDVKVIWFDGLYRQEKYDGQRFLDLIHKLQPATLINDRIGVTADYVTPEQFIPKAIPTKDVHIFGTDTSVQGAFRAGVPSAADFQLWETCMTINETWAYNVHDTKFKSTLDLVRGLVEVTSRGGNFLLNIGPQPDGIVQPEFQERLRGIGEWMAINGESIYGTTFGPIQGEAGYRTTSKRNEVFIHMLDWPVDGLTINSLKPKILSVQLLANHQPLTFRQSETGVHISLPSQPPGQSINVVRILTL